LNIIKCRKINNLINNRLIKNFISLSSSHILGFILPLITFPYIIKVIGVSKFGEITIMLTIMTFLNVIVDFGYNYNAPKEVSISRDDSIALSKLVSVILSFKVLLFSIIFVFSFIIFFLLFEANKYLYFGGIVYLLNLISLPNWFFQGVERMEFITIIDSISKIIFTLLIFILIKLPEDYILILPLFGLGGFISAIVGFYIIFYKFKVKYVLPRSNEIYEEYKKGIPIFLANIATHSFNNSSIILLGTLCSSLEVGLFAIADKIAKVPWAIASVSSSVIFPRVCYESKKGVSAMISFFKKVMPLFIIGVSIIIVTLILFRVPIVSYFSTTDIDKISLLLFLLLISIFPIVLNIPYSQMILALNFDTVYMRIFVIIAVVDVVFSFIIIAFFGSVGAAVSQIFIKFLLLLLLFINYKQINKSNINI
jgi:polysaccharide transporter, PST family